ncbi:MAG: hypothetical protein DRP66_03940 [Planctomycetota bacterium]|nr:MAG: hypothetical protein DRP66_03940 [Planctomycetota bacterium]
MQTPQYRKPASQSSVAAVEGGNGPATHDRAFIETATDSKEKQVMTQTTHIIAAELIENAFSMADFIATIEKAFEFF